MFKEKHARRLEDEPITVKIGENEEYTLRPLKEASLPKSKEIIDVLRLMETANDYQNLVPFMSGLWNSQMTVSAARWQYLVRKTADAGKLSLIVECARQAHRTGLSLENHDFTERLFLEIHRMAQEAEYKGPQLAKALKVAQNAAEIMDTYASDPATNPKYQPYVIGTLLELSAARALDEFGGKDQTNEVANYGKKLYACWSLGKFQGSVRKEFDAEHVDRELTRTIAIYKGLKLAMTVDGFRRQVKNAQSRLDHMRKLLTGHLEMIPAESFNKVYSAKLAKTVLEEN